jgi:hypothetical protein
MMPALNVTYLIMEIMKNMNMIVVDMHFVQFIIVGRGVDMGMYAAMW